MNMYLMAAGAASFITFAIHTWIGGPAIAGPLLRSNDMHDVPKYTNYYCWHMATVTLFGLGTAFMWAAFYPEAVELAWAGFLLSTASMLLNVGLIIGKKQHPLQMPQWALFLTISSLAGLGLWL